MEDSTIGFGTFPLKEELMQLIPIAKDSGYSLVDTSDDYYNENFVAIASADTRIKIITKFSFVENVLKFSEYFEAQKKIFSDNGSRITCYLLHWPYPHLYKKIWKRMEDLYLAGEVEEIGVCNFTVRNLKDLLRTCRVKPMYNEIELHPLFQQREITDYCKQNGIKVISYSPFARHEKMLFSNQTMQMLAQKHHTSIANIILKWNLEKGFIPIPSTSNINHLKEMSVEQLNTIMLSKEDIERIDLLECGKRVRFNPDSYFGRKTKLKFLIYSFLLK